MPTLRSIVNESDTPEGRAFDIGVQVLILASMVGLAIETLPDLPPAWRSAVVAFERFSLAAFTCEYCLRLATAHRPVRYATSFFGVIDLVAILPSIIGLGFDLRALRTLRLLRVFRILKLARYSAALRRLHLAVIIAREEIVLFGAFAAVLVFLASVGIYYCEHEAQPDVFASIPHSLWWSIVTLTTVGYGDAYPITTAGKVFTGLLLVAGLGVVSIPCGLVASALSKAREIHQEEIANSTDLR